MSLLKYLLRHKYGHGHYGAYRHYDDDHHHDSLLNMGHGYSPSLIGDGTQILKNKKVLYALLAVCCTGLLLLIALLFFLFPMVLSVIDYVGKGGIKGVVETLTSIINRLWEGQGK
jgi:hypothetical protein